MYLGHVSGRKVVPDCRRLGRDRRLQIVGCKKDIPCVLASTLIPMFVPKEKSCRRRFLIQNPITILKNLDFNWVSRRTAHT